MKLKAVVHTRCLGEIVYALNNLRQAVITNVLLPHLHMKSPGPAEFYVQQCDYADSGEPFCEVRLSGVSLNDDRATNDFRNARNDLELLYRAAIQAYLPKGQRMQLFVVIMLDAPLPNGSSLVEGEPIFVEGEA